MKLIRSVKRIAPRATALLLLALITLLAVSCGAGKRTPAESAREMSALLDTERFKAGLTENSFKSLIGGYRYENLDLTAIAEVGTSSSATKKTYAGFADTFEFTYEQRFVEGAEAPYEVFASLTALEALDGLSLPEGIGFGDKFDTVAKRLGLGSGLRAKFTPDEGKETDMTVYSEDGYTVVLQNLLRNGTAADDSDPIRLIFTETTENGAAGGTTVRRTVTLLFSGGSTCVLSGIGYAVTETVTATK